MRAREVARKFDEIVEFSGVERHIDTPVKWYSSGMYVRLGVRGRRAPRAGDPDRRRGARRRRRRVPEALPRPDERGRPRGPHRPLRQPQHAGRAAPLRARDPARRTGELVADGDTEAIVRQLPRGRSTRRRAGRRRWDDPDDAAGRRLLPPRRGPRHGRATAAPATTFFTSASRSQVTLEFDLERRRSRGSTVGFDLADGRRRRRVLLVLHATSATTAASALRPGRNALRCDDPAGPPQHRPLRRQPRASRSHGDPLDRLRGRRSCTFDVVADHGESLFLHARRGRPGVVAPSSTWAGGRAGADARRASAALPARR